MSLETTTFQLHEKSVIDHERLALLDLPKSVSKLVNSVGVAAVGSRMLQSTPTPLLQLTSEFLTIVSMDTTPSSDKEAYAHVLRDFILPLTRARIEKPRAEADFGGTYNNSCPVAERSFADLVAQVKNPRQKDLTYRNDKVSTYLSNTGVPMLLRKTVDVSTALSLVDIEMPGLVLPAGTIVNIDHEGTSQIAERVKYGATYKTFEFGGTPKIRPLRLSPWAFDDPMDMTLFADRAIKNPTVPDFEDTGKLVHLGIKDFRQAALRVMEFCSQR